MTDVMDDSVSWEQRREMRRKKRQELLAEADRLVKKTDEVASSNTTSRYSRDHAQMDEEDDFEKERQRRRREREERRRKEREELEKQLKEEEESRLERERRREERRRLREESEREIAESHAPTTTYTSSTVITKEVESHDDYNGEEETTVTTETTEVVQEYTITQQNGHYDEPEEQSEEVEKAESEDLHNGVNEDEEPEEEEEEEEEEPEPEVEIKQTYKTSVTTVTVKSKPDHHHEDDEVDEVKQKLDELKLKRQMSDKRRYEPLDDSNETEEERKERIKQLEERRRLREQKRLEEEQKEKEEAAKREAEYQERLQREKEERERRRAEAEEKRKEFRKKLSQSEEQEVASPLSPKSLNSPLVSKRVDSLANQDSDSSIDSELSNSSSSNSVGKSKIMDGSPKSRPPAVPRRTQSTRIRLSDYKQSGLKVTDGSNDKELSYHPSRPLARKNRTRRSLDAMEKQADDLYDFLSELEHKKASCSGDELLNFLQTKEGDKSKTSSPAKGSSLTKRASIKDRAKVFSSIKEENAENTSGREMLASKATKSQKPSESATGNVLLPISNERPRSYIRSEGSISPSRQSPNRNYNNNNNNNSKQQVENLQVDEILSTDKTSIEKESVVIDEKENLIDIVKIDSENVVVEEHMDKAAHDKTVKEVKVSVVAVQVKSAAPRHRRKPNIPHKPGHLQANADKKTPTEDRPKCSDQTPAISNASAQSSNPDKNIPLTEKDQEITSADTLPLKTDVPTQEQPKSESSSSESRLLTHDQIALSPLATEGIDGPTERVEQLNKHLTETPKQSSVRDTKVARAEGLDSRLEKYTKQASKQEAKRTPSSAAPGGKGGHDVSDRRNKWERGEVHSAEKSVRKEHVIGAGGISSRRNLWESGRAGGASAKASKEVAEVKGADFSSRKNLWLKVSQQQGATKKSESPVGMKTGVMSRLNQWEKGAVAGQTHDKPKTKSDVPHVAALGGRRAMYEQKAAGTTKSTPSKQSVKLNSDVSDRKQRWESRSQEQAKSRDEERPLSSASDRDGSYDGRRSYDDDSSQGRYQEELDVSDEE